MNRRQMLLATSAALITSVTACRGHRYGQILKSDDSDMVGSATAGSATFNPLIDESVGKLIGRHAHQFQLASSTLTPPVKPRICFVGVENRSAEELGDFRDQIYQQIDNRILQSGTFQTISPRFVSAALRKTQLRVDDLYDPENMRLFSAALEQEGQPFEFMLHAVLTSGTTTANHDYQRDYLLTLELSDPRTGMQDKESAPLRKGYHHSRVGKLKHYNWFTRKK